MKPTPTAFSSPKNRRLLQRQTVSTQSTLSSSSSLESDTITILGFGSLLSEKSSRLTFPDLTNFRLGRVPGYRRTFAHPASIFFQRKIADLDAKTICSLSVEKDVGNLGFIVSVFEVSKDGLFEDGIPSQAFLEREEEFCKLVALNYQMPRFL